MFALIVSSCTTCNEQMTSDRTVKLKFAKVSGKTFADSTIGKLEIIYFNASKTDSNYFGVLKFSLPLDEGHDSSAFVIYTDSLKNSKTPHIDTLIFYYKTDLELISSDCGFNVRFTNLILKPTHYHIDTVLNKSNALSSDLNTLNFTIVLKVNPAE